MDRPLERRGCSVCSREIADDEESMVRVVRTCCQCEGKQPQPGPLAEALEALQFCDWVDRRVTKSHYSLPADLRDRILTALRQHNP